MAYPLHPYRPLIEEACRYAFTVPPDVLEAMVYVETGGTFDPKSRSKSGALGLTQIIPRYHAKLMIKIADDVGMDPTDSSLYDPRFSLYAGARHLAYTYSLCKTWDGAVSMYHSGQCNPPSDFVDGQGTSTTKHIQKFHAALEMVRADRGAVTPKEPAMAVQFFRRIATNRLDEFGLLRDLEADFTLHENGNTASSPFDEAAFVKNGGGDARVMYHFSVGVEDGKPTIVQIFPLDRKGKHAGNAEGNATSIAVEICQSPPGALSDQTQEALQELMFMVYTKDPRIDWGTSGKNYTFSPNRTRGHKDWPGANPKCPEFITRQWGGVKPIVDKARARLEAKTPTPTPDVKPSPTTPDIDLPEGMTLDIAKALFGEAKDSNNLTYRFDPTGKGVISKAWLEIGKREKKFPTLTAVHIDGKARYFAFSNGTVLWHPVITDPVRVLGDDV